MGLGWVRSLSVKTCPQVLFGWDTFFNVVRTCYNISAIVACKAKPPARPCIWLVFWYIHNYTYIYTHILVYTCIYCICIIYSIVDIIWFTCHWFWLSVAGICSSLDVMSLIAPMFAVSHVPIQPKTLQQFNYIPTHTHPHPRICI
jgi:hypothetical protein